MTKKWILLGLFHVEQIEQIMYTEYDDNIVNKRMYVEHVRLFKGLFVQYTQKDAIL